MGCAKIIMMMDVTFFARGIVLDRRAIKTGILPVFVPPVDRSNGHLKCPLV